MLENIGLAPACDPLLVRSPSGVQPVPNIGPYCRRRDSFYESSALRAITYNFVLWKHYGTLSAWASDCRRRLYGRFEPIHVESPELKNGVARIMAGT